MKFTVELTEKQVEKLLAAIDCATTEQEPDWFLYTDGSVWSPALVAGKPAPHRTLQEHLDLILDKVEI